VPGRGHSSMVTEEVRLLRTLVQDLETELKTKVSENSVLEAEVRSLQRQLAKRDNEILKQDRELHKLRSVLQQASSLLPSDKDVLAEEVHSVAGSIALNKKQGVSGQSVQPAANTPVYTVEKDFHSKTLIKEAILENDFLKNLSLTQVSELVEAMHEKKIPKGCYVIREGESGSYLYVAAEGEFEVVKTGKKLGSLGVGKVFGELAILYNCKRTASVKATTDGKVWALERKVFQQIMVTSGIKRMENQLNFLRSVPLLAELPSNILLRISDALEPEQFQAGEVIVREGTAGDTFYILSSGEVTVSKRAGNKEEIIRELSSGSYFGEQALLRTDLRTASVTARTAVDCLALDRESFFQLVGDLQELKEKVYSDTAGRGKDSREFNPQPSEECQDVELDDLEVVATLGVGGFGRVELVKVM